MAYDYSLAPVLSISLKTGLSLFPCLQTIDQNTAAILPHVLLYCNGWAHAEDKESRSNGMIALSCRMNNSLSLLMVQGNSTVAISTRKCIINLGHQDRKKLKRKTKTCPKSIERMVKLMCGVNFRTSRVTKSDSIPSVDWLQFDKHGKHHTHHRLPAKQINKAPSAHMPDRLTETQHKAYLETNKYF